MEKTRTRQLTDKEKLQLGEIAYFENLLNLYPTGIVSVVSDTFDLWNVLTNTLPKLKEKILKREGKLVIRPDSGDPVDILCGYPNNGLQVNSTGADNRAKAAQKGVIELLWDTFGGTINDKGYKVLDPHIGAIYGDSITLDRAKAICERLKAKGFASTNVVLGIGSFTYQYNTRDTFGFAVKATYGEITHKTVHLNGDGTYGEDTTIEPREIFKDPITDDGTKKSAKGLLRVDAYDREVKQIYVKDQCTPQEEQGGLLETVFLDGQLVKFQTLSKIRELLNKSINDN